MCRMFNEDEEISGTVKHQKQHNYLPSEKKHKRFRRNVDENLNINPKLNNAHKNGVEKMVDKLYNEIDEKGEGVILHQNVNGPTTKTRKIPSRRLNFAPAKLLGPLPVDEKKDIGYESSGYDESVSRFKHGIVPYYIDSKTYDADLAESIIKAFDYFEKATCIRLQRLRERPTDKESLKSVSWLYITNPTGIRQCVHSNERMETSGVQMIVLGYDCMSSGDIAHEIMHVLGFSHEHTRRDRDNHITVLWDNIKPGYKKYFDISERKFQSTVESLPYDHASVLHYPSRAFSRNGQVTIIAKSGIQIGQRTGLSETDIEKVSLVYSKECIKRNKDYLLKTCPSVVKNGGRETNITQREIEDYFKDRLWPFGIVNFKLMDKIEFSAEEKENIRSVISHIEKETCIKFKDVTDDNDLPASNDVSEKQVDGPKNETSDKDDEAASPNLSENEVKTSNDETEMKQASAENEATNVQLVKQNNNTKRFAMNTASEIRRHAMHILVLKRSTQPGCTCPPPGRFDGYKELEINSDCFNSVNDLLHVFVHVLGLDHQHSMYDRDQYLHIVWDNLSSDMREEMKVILPPAASVGFQYDYQSVMHYPWLQIKNGVTNIMYPIWNDGWAMGHWQGLSSTDVQKLNLLYFNQCTARSMQENN
uniref:Metalloendopeptidase n=1 Tax=Bombyx mori TaxID=7091 RepID=A0A8R2C7F9_BOMMO|nr:uncharacterized protein LOC101746911 [Bombyx mori]